MSGNVKPFIGALYSAPLRAKLEQLIVPRWNADELWGEKEISENFRACLVGTADDCAQVWQNWLQQGTFVRDQQPCFYVLEQRFVWLEKHYERWAVFATVPALPGALKVHEAVSLDGAENIRERCEKSRADLTPVFVATEESAWPLLTQTLQDAVAGNKPELVYRESELESHKIWRIADAQNVAKISDFFSGHSLYLLDGHHRYQGAQNNQRLGHGDGRLLACICTLAPADVLIRPIHRTVVCEEWLLPQRSIAQLEELGCVFSAVPKWSKESLSAVVDSLVPGSREFLFLPVQSAELYRVRPPSESQYELLVEQLEREIFPKISGAALLPVNEVSFVVDQLALGQAQAAVFLPAVAAKNVREIADAGQLLPRKSTQFHPKPALGLVCRPWA